MAYASFDMVGSYDTDFDTIIDGQRTINMYEILDAGSPEGKALIPIPGSKLKIFAEEEPDNAECRAAFTVRNESFFVIGSGVYLIDDILAFTKIGTLNTTSGFVQISANQTQVIFVDGGRGYIWDGSVLVVITNVAFPSNPVTVDFLDGRFLVGDGASNKWFISKENDGLIWNALEFAELTTAPDTIVAISVLKRRIFIMGETSVEVWYDAGSPGFPFGRDNNLAYEFGCAARGSVANSQGYLIWLGRTVNGVASVMMTTGGEIEAVSTRQVDLAFQEYSKVDDARSFIYKINGQIFYVINFPTPDKTWSYDVNTRKWFELEMLDGTRYFGQVHTFLNNVHLIGAYNEPKIFLVSRDFNTNNGESIRQTRVSKIFRPVNGGRLAINLFELRFRQGDSPKVDASGDIYFDDAEISYTDDGGVAYFDDFFIEDSQFDRDPVIYLSTSTNGGKTFGNEVSQPYGKLGEYEFRTIWNRLGMGTQFTFKMVKYNSVPLILTGCDINYDVLRL